MITIHLPFLTATLVALQLLSFTAFGNDNDAAQRAQIDARMAQVERLVQSSSAAKRVQSSGNPKAKQYYARTRELLAQARVASERGELTQATDLLRETTQSMFEATRNAEARDIVLEKARQDFENRLSSINTLMNAHERVSKEKGVEPTHDELYAIVNGLTAKARASNDAGDPIGGRKLLDEAYVAVKFSLESLRGGDTLVRSLNFASKEEEYHYELDRNDTHRMLVEVLAREKLAGNDGLKKLVKSSMDKADSLREDAEKLAANEQFADAVIGLEESTKNVVRAIRSAGIYIPN